MNVCLSFPSPGCKTFPEFSYTPGRLDCCFLLYLCFSVFSFTLSVCSACIWAFPLDLLLTISYSIYFLFQSNSFLFMSIFLNKYTPIYFHPLIFFFIFLNPCIYVFFFKFNFTSFLPLVLMSLLQLITVKVASINSVGL